MAETAASNWAARGAWSGIARPGESGGAAAAGVTVRLEGGFGLATLIAPESAAASLAGAVRAMLGLDLPSSPAASASESHALLWSGPGQWLLRARERSGFHALLAGLSAHAAVSDQSDARAALRLSGARVRDVLAKGSMVDLHPSAFPIHAVALTSFAHVGVQLWRGEDGPDGPVFEVLVARSMAGSFWAWFSASAAEFGCHVISGRD